jgi:hypothetical protein
MESPILITGAARSGTSMVAGVINQCGAFGGKMSGPNRNNAKGMFENSYIRNSIVKPYLRKLNVDAKGQYPLPDINNLKPYPELRQHVIDTMLSQGYQSGPWMYKGAKMCLHWPIWNTAFPNAKWIIVRRRSEGIVNSCMRTGFMNAFDKQIVRKAVQVNTAEEGWKWWVKHHEKKFVEMFQAGLNGKSIWPHRMIDGDFSELRHIIEWLGLDYDEKKVKEFIEPKLYNSKGI